MKTLQILLLALLAALPLKAQDKTRVRVVNQSTCRLAVRIVQGSNVIKTVRVDGLTTVMVTVENNNTNIAFRVEPLACADFGNTQTEQIDPAPFVALIVDPSGHNIRAMREEAVPRP